MTISQNLRAFLQTLAFSEGTINIPNSDGGYRAEVGGGTFESYDDHPHVVVKLNDHLSSSAAGKYQILARYWDVYKKQLGLQDFSSASQDAVAIQQIRECHALDDINAGKFNVAVTKCAHIWASLPGAGYNQPERRLDDLRMAYVQYGGKFA